MLDSTLSTALRDRTGHGKPMRDQIVLVWYWGTGGAGMRLTERIARTFAATQGADRVAVSCHADNDGRARLLACGHPVSVVHGPTGHRRIGALLLHALPRSWSFLRHLRLYRPEAVIIPMNFAMAWPLAIMLRLLDIPLIYMLHDAQPHPGDYAPRWQVYTQRKILRLCRAVLAPSLFTAGEIKRLFPDSPPVVAVPLSALAQRRRTEPRLRPSRPLRLLFLGRLMAYKGLELLAQALAPLAERSDWTLTIAGTGPEEAGVRAAFGALPQVNLSLIRHLEEPEIEALMDSHDVLVCTYLEASQSGPVSEALASGMPCLVTPTGALAEQIAYGAAGWIATDITAAAVRSAILDMLQDLSTYQQRSNAALSITQPL